MIVEEESIRDDIIFKKHNTQMISKTQVFRAVLLLHRATQEQVYEPVLEIGLHTTAFCPGYQGVWCVHTHRYPCDLCLGGLLFSGCCFNLLPKACCFQILLKAVLYTVLQKQEWSLRKSMPWNLKRVNVFKRKTNRWLFPQLSIFRTVLRFEITRKSQSSPSEEVVFLFYF